MTTRPNTGAGVSRYLRLYSVLSQALADGRFGAGQLLPSEPRLMREYGLSRATVRRALDRLEAEERIVRRKGSGTYARDQGLAPEGAAALPAITINRTVTFEHIPTPGFLSGDQPGFGETTLLIRRIGYARREPVVLETVYCPQEIGELLTRRQLARGDGAILSILATLGHRGSSVEREFAALPADPFAANSLGLAVGAPILNVRMVARDSQQRTLAYINLSYRPDRHEARAAIELDGHKQNRTGRRS